MRAQGPGRRCLGLLGLAAACGDKAGPATQDTGPPPDTAVVCVEEDPCLCEPPALQVGTGDDTFSPLSDGDPVMMVHGPQGGWHMLGSVRVHHTTDIVRIHFVIATEAGVVVADNQLNVLLVAEPDCAGSYPGMYAYIDVSELVDGDLDTPPELLAYASLDMTATVVDQDGREVTETVRIVATPDPSDVEPGDGG